MAFNWMMRSSRKLLCRTWVVVILAFLLHACSIAFMITALSTNHWVEIKVDREQLALGYKNENQSFVFTQERGIFMTCYPDKEAEVFLMNEDVVNDNCVKEDGFKLKTLNTSDSDSDDAFTQRTHLLRSIVACFCISGVLSLVTFVGAWVSLGKGKISSLRKVAGFVFLNCVLLAAAMLLFQYLNYNEENVIKYDRFPAGWKAKSSLKSLVENSEISFGYSYILGWASLVTSICPPIMYLFVARTLLIRIQDENTKLLHGGGFHTLPRPQSRKQSTRPLSSGGDIYYTSNTERNPAYDYLQKDKKSHMTI